METGLNRSKTLKFRKRIANFTNFARHLIRRDLYEFAGYVGASDRVIDLGCGMVPPYRNLFSTKNYIGVDLFERAGVQADITHLPFLQSIADVVILTEVLEHMSDPSKVLQEIRRVLKPEGFLVLTIPLLMGEHDYVDYYRWTTSGIQKLLTESGFKITLFKKRGAIFSSIGMIMYHIPISMFGGLTGKMNWLIRIIHYLMIPFFIVMPWILSLFDFLDRQRNFVFGYSILCRKNELEQPVITRRMAG